MYGTSNNISMRVGKYTNAKGIAQVIIKWRGKPVFIRHRTEDEIKEAEETKWESLRDPQPDSDRVKKPEWLIMLGMFPIAASTNIITMSLVLSQGKWSEG